MFTFRDGVSVGNGGVDAVVFGIGFGNGYSNEDKNELTIAIQNIHRNRHNYKIELQNTNGLVFAVIWVVALQHSHVVAHAGVVSFFVGDGDDFASPGNSNIKLRPLWLRGCF
jgi:hypothetical protein